MTEAMTEAEMSEATQGQTRPYPSQARQDELKRILVEAKERWESTNNGEKLTDAELFFIVRDIYRQRKLDYIYARIKPVTPADYNFLTEYLAPDVQGDASNIAAQAEVIDEGQDANKEAVSESAGEAEGRSMEEANTGGSSKRRKR